MKINFDNIKIIKLLGTGVSGTTYLVSYKNKKYTLKIQHIFESDIKNKKSCLWNEINFSKYVSKYSETFKRIYDYKIIDNCNFVKNNKSIGLKIFGNKKVIQQYYNLQKSKFCIKFLGDYYKKELGQIIHKLNIKQIYSLLLQLLYGIYLLQKKKYTHNDFNINNIIYNKTNKK